MFNFDKEVSLILKNAELECINDGVNYLSSIYLLLSILKSDNSISKILNKYDIYYDSINRVKKKKNKGFIFYTNDVKKILELSIINARDFKLKEVNIVILFLSLLDIGESKSYDYLSSKIDIDRLYVEVKNLLFNKSSLDNMGTFLTDYDNIKTFDKVYNREKEIDRIINILLRKKKNNPILIGEAGVGKSAIIEELARRIYEKDVPKSLYNKRILSIRISSLIAGTKYRGEFEEKFDKLIKEVLNNEDIILFIDEIHTIIGAGGSEGAIDASNILKPFLARGNIKLIGATTTYEYDKYISKDKAFQRRFESVLIKEPNYKETVDILNNIKNDYEDYHNVSIPNSVIDKIVMYSKKYITSSHEPDKSIDLLDEVCTYKNIKNNKYSKNNTDNKLSEVTYLKNQYLKCKDYKTAYIYKLKEEKILSKSTCKKVNLKDLDEVIEMITGNKIFSSKDKSKLIKYFNDNSIPLDVSKELSLSFLEYSNNINDKPYVLLTNINKVGDSLNEFSNYNYININLEEYSYNEIVTKFVGSPSGYIGYDDNNTIFESLKIHKNSIIEFNNIDKCNKSIFNIIKSIIDKGYLINNKSEKIDFSNTFIILTRNVKNKKVGFNNVFIDNKIDINFNKIVNMEETNIYS